MPNKILTENVVKKLFNKFCGTEDTSYKLNKHTIKEDIDLLNNNGLENKLVCKVDQFIKGRKNKGLVLLNSNKEEILEFVKQKSYDNFIIEKMVNVKQEYYFAIRATVNGNELLFSIDGGIDIGNIEDVAKKIQLNIIIEELSNDIVYSLISSIKEKNIIEKMCAFIKTVFSFYITYNFNYLEINPVALTTDNVLVPIDFAVIYDDASLYKYTCQTYDLLSYEPIINSELTDQEITIKNLDELSGSSLKFTLLNKNGSIWTLIAGGGASVLYTDAIVNRGLMNKLANYGEYSGNPSEELVYEYVCNIFSLLIKSESSDPFYLLIGGGIANFTLIDKTFAGIYKGLIEYSEDLKKKDIQIYVRRGGPNYEYALEQMNKICDECNIKCEVYGPEYPITKIVSKIERELDKINELENNISVENYVDTNYTWKSFNPNFDKCFIYGFQKIVLQRMLDFDYISKKEYPSVIALIDTQKKSIINVDVYFGKDKILIPVYNNLEIACIKHPYVNGVINYSSFRSAFKTSLDCLQQPSIEWIAVIAEGIPERDSKLLTEYAINNKKTVLGPSTVGGIVGSVFRIGNTGGAINNIIKSRLHKKGDVGLCTRSGGLLNEMVNIISKITNGIHTAMSIGGDKYPGTNFVDILMAYEQNEDIKVLVVLGEVGGHQEILLANMVKTGLIKKKVIAWTIGTSASEFGYDMQFGHAGACAGSETETSIYKNKYMRNCGIHVPNTFEEMENLLLNIYSEFKNPIDKKNKDLEDWNKIVKSRNDTNFFCSISNETGEELMYNGIKVSQMKHTFGNSIGHLWFKKQLSDKFIKYIELCLFITADHGPCVSGAQNTIISTRAGKDMVSSVCSGLLTIGPKFGGAINEAAQNWYRCIKENIGPEEFINDMKKNGKLILGIGHKYKTKNNPDKRVVLLDNYMKKNYDNNAAIDFAKRVEKLTLKKRNNLILNVDGFIAASLIDCFISDGFTKDEIEEIICNDILNGFFILARTVGFIGHHIDQKRLKQGLFRHPIKQICYL